MKTLKLLTIITALAIPAIAFGEGFLQQGTKYRPYGEYGRQKRGARIRRATATRYSPEYGEIGRISVTEAFLAPEHQALIDHAKALNSNKRALVKKLKEGITPANADIVAKKAEVVADKAQKVADKATEIKEQAKSVAGKSAVAEQSE